MECFVAGELARFREVEISQRATTYKIDLGSANKPKKNRPGGKSKKNSGTKNVVAADLARLRALRRMRHMFPDVFAIVYAEERHKAGLDPKPHPQQGYLKNAVETYVAFTAYHAASDRSE